MNLHFTVVFYPKAKEGEAGLLILYMPLEKLQLQSEKRSNLARWLFKWLSAGGEAGGQKPCTQMHTDPNSLIQPILKSSAELLGHAVTDPIDKQECVEAVGKAFICEEKLLRFISPAAIHFSKEMRQRYCCYSNSWATHQPILHRGAAFGGRLFQSSMGSNWGCGSRIVISLLLKKTPTQKPGGGGEAERLNSLYANRSWTWFTGSNTGPPLLCEPPDEADSTFTYFFVYQLHIATDFPFPRAAPATSIQGQQLWEAWSTWLPSSAGTCPALELSLLPVEKQRN